MCPEVNMNTCAVVLLCVLIFHGSIGVFLDKDGASAVLQRVRRANSFLEETKRGNLERECIEEICDYEEAREVFEDDTKTKQFWLSYPAKEPCLANPCQNNGTCVYMASSYSCLCLEGFEGKYCEKGFEDALKCLHVNGGCEQFCEASGHTHSCRCATGYTLGADGTSCVAQVEYPCGKIPLQTTNTDQKQRAGGLHCPRGHCPWQALIDYNGESVCGGALLDGDWVVTAAHCVHQKDLKRLKVITGDHDLDVMDGSEEAYDVSAVVIHESYDPVSLDSDLALLKLHEELKRSAYAVPVCLPTPQLAQVELVAVRFHTLSGWSKRTAGHIIHASLGLSAPSSGVLQRLSVPLVPTDQCVSSSHVNLTANMFCAGYVVGEHQSCRGHDGSPLVTRYEGTSFLTGVVSWGRGCHQPGYYGIYTKVANFLKWIEVVVKTPVEGLNNISGSPVVYTRG